MQTSALNTIRIAACDLNGLMRGKRSPAAKLEALEHGVARLPFSALNVDIWGRDIENSPLVFESGDADGVLRPSGRGPVPMPWLTSETALIPMTLYDEDGHPFPGDPRHALASILERYSARGWSVIAATELEFHLLDDSGTELAPVKDPLTGRRLAHHSVLSLSELDAFDAFFTELYAGAEAMGIPAQDSISEGGIGQFEININHQDAMRAADDTWLFKSLVKGLARKHGFAASFMAKPFADDAGNGMHVHFSVVDGDGVNVFDDGGANGTAVLQSAIAGCLAAMPDSTLIFAPHANSYQRLVPGSHAPTAAAWGYENRTAALRVPGGSPKARRIEHRVSGGDVNPYLQFSAILGAALLGIEDELTPPAPVSGNVYEQGALPGLAASWADAIDRIENSLLLPRIFPTEIITNLVMTKRQEFAGFAEIAEDKHWLSLLDAV